MPATNSHPSFYKDRTCDAPPVWRFVMGSFYVLHAADGVGSSNTLGSVGELRRIHGTDHYGRSATIMIPGTREIQGCFGLSLGVFQSDDNAKHAVELAVAERHADPIAYDAAARIADRQRVSMDVARAILTAQKKAA